MIEIKTLNDIEKIAFGKKLIAQKLNSLNYLEDDLSLKSLIEKNICYWTILNDILFYQIEDENNLNILREGITYSKSGLWGLITAFPIEKEKYYIFHQREDEISLFLIIDDKLEIIRESIKGCNYGIGNYLFRRYGNKIICFDSQTKMILWKREYEHIVNINGYSLKNKTIVTTTENGMMFTLDIPTGDLKWKQDRVGKAVIFQDMIYCLSVVSLAEFELKTLDAASGKLIQSKKITNLFAEFNFLPTGEIKVYDEYIFSMAAGRPGRVAIFNRNSLEFVELIELEEMITTGQDHLHWHNNRLYILDFGKKLHIYEQE